MDRQLVKDLKDKDSVQSVFLVRGKNINLGKNGRPFMSLQLGDHTGTLDARVWDNVDDVSREFEAGDLVKTRGLIQLYQNRKQLIVHKLEKLIDPLLNPEDFLIQSSFNPEDLFAEVLTFVRSMKNEHLRQLCIDVIEDTEIKPLFLQAPAAKSIHHAWKGGLIEHVTSIMKILDFMSKNYSFLNRDFLIFGALFHDIGKIWELSYGHSFSYTDRGRLIGHMEIACELIDRKSTKILGFQQDLRDLCKHIVLSHHGKQEYGSPKTPHFIEAYLVAMVDDLDSKMSTIHQFVTNERQNSTDRWSRLNEMFERYFLLDDLKEKY
ncbi:MAG: OB-fold nucleic acid binding domain-containing protein [Bdellovibrionota bacterium]